MKEHSFVIEGTLPGLNELIAANRTHKQKGATLKRHSEMLIRSYIRQQLRKVHFDNQIQIDYVFYEKNRRRDHDNVFSTAAKFIQDSLVKEGIIKNDGWKEISGFTARFEVDAARPRIEVTLSETMGE